ncbi:XIAP-associated factor 1 [Pleurodeles waltl]|uniref:XIAP-associated factor 1 n=1 Tax=Pleurodeles waltl TaxID=8319 RepID=UPI003709788E
MEEETQFCGNCKKNVALTNFSLHEVHCRRFLKVCPECGEPVPHKDMQQHQDESHRKVKCDLCHQSIQQYLLEEHKAEECDERSVRCQFCELDLAFCKLKEHADTCGSRTELCHDCKKYVMIKDLEDHKHSCLPSTALPDKSVRKKGGAAVTGHRTSVEFKRDKESDFSKKVRCPKCSAQLPESMYLRHQNECSPLPQVVRRVASMPCRRNADNFTSFSPVLKHWREIESSLPDKASTEKDDDVMKIKSREFSFESRCLPPCTQETSLHLKGLLGRSSFSFYNNKQSGQDGLYNTAYDVLQSCPHCSILLPSPTLKQHEQKCKFLASLSDCERA